MTLPASLFISHGSPDIVLHDTAAKKFLEGASEILGKPKGIVIVSAHFETEKPTIVSDPAPGMIYDFGGFDRRLREIIYPAPGDEGFAEKLAACFVTSGIDFDILQKRGYDHGAWVPLSLLYAEADIPIVQLSVQPDQPASHHYQLGVALRPLVQEGLLVIGSGSITHNLSVLFSPNGLLYDREDKEVGWARVFADWVAEQITDGATDKLQNYAEEAPFAAENHPTSEHFLPLFVALGAATDGKGWRLHKSTEFAVLAMDAFAFH